ncbi:putative NAD(P)/FAD-binding protein YdhS [Ochrobactrum sp. 19YEA23]|uniref:FAD/NAD(P)-binding protein n=1 Tax=Ochrobactrum sp. 19YEA23 TaxID=3039854 RepID=UPI0024785CB9|nr:putative NAD(P)/FAD-binding protein YdhS [Ochrobactrum sp. 19YEA23]
MLTKAHTGTVAIIGGGFTGAAVALHLARQLSQQQHDASWRIVVIEPREKLGRGLAYDTLEPVHRINVPADRMSILPDEPQDFSNWLAETGILESDPDAFSLDGAPFPARTVFGLYASSRLGPLIEAGSVEHRRTRAMNATKDNDFWTIETEDGDPVIADVVVLAVSHPAPSLPGVLDPIREHQGLIADATRPGALDKVQSKDRVLVVGNGLTAADVIATLKAHGHKGRIVSISRRGLRSRGHPRTTHDPYGDFITEPSLSPSKLLHRVRKAIKAAQAEGLSWHPVLDAVRLQGQDIWRALPVSERRRIARHVRPFWDVHRFRIAPQVENALDSAVADGSLSVRAASVRIAESSGDTLRISLKDRRTGELDILDVDKVVVTTGPGHGGILGSQPLLTALAAAEHLALCPTGLGLLCDRRSRAISTSGFADETLLIAGPLARGTFGELMGLPQVSEHAVLVAGVIATLIAERDRALEKAAV